MREVAASKKRVWRRGRGGKGGQIPEARVVVGKHAPAWQSQPRQAPPQPAVSYSYERVAPAGQVVLAVLYGFWPMMLIFVGAIALLWGGSVANSP